MAPPPTGEQLIAEAKQVSKTDPAKAAELYKEVLSKPPGVNETALRDYETALIGLGELYRDYKNSKDLSELVKTSRQTLSSFAKAKTAKLGKICYCKKMSPANGPTSSATPRPLCGYSKLFRDSNQYDKIMYRLGSLGKAIVFATEP